MHVETCVIGAGVIGLATARALAFSGREVLILERGCRIGEGTSSRNSEVVHAGIYYPPNSNKARLSVRGRSLLYNYAHDRNIPYDKKGKFIVATNETQMKVDIPQLIQNANRNGVDDLVLLSGEDIQTLEPQVSCIGGLYSPSTGIIDSHGLMMSLLADAEDSGAVLALNSNVTNIVLPSHMSTSGNLIIETDGVQLQCSTVINCAGLYSDKINIQQNSSTTAGSEKQRIISQSRQFYAKGNYYRLEGVKSPFKHLIYPVPEKGGLGIHASIDLAGMTRFGPDVEWQNVNITPDDIDLSVDTKRVELFYSQIEKYWPSIRDTQNCLSPDYSGVRPKLFHPQLKRACQPMDTDFKILGYNDHGIKGFVTLLGIESPGLTSSMAIAETVKSILDDSE